MPVPVPVPAPAIDARCPDGQVVSIESLRGQNIRIAAGPGAITLGPASTAGCQTDVPEICQAYAIVTGLTPESLSGTTLLVDRDGWLRARVSRSIDIPALLRWIDATPLVAPATPMHHH